MGTPIEPDGSLYIEGVNCAACRDVIFDGKTPKYIKAVFAAIVTCPPAPPVPPLPVIQLEQVPGFPCVWAGVLIEGPLAWVCEYTCSWHLDPLKSQLALLEGMRKIFSAELPVPCAKFFNNQLTCIGGDGVEGGTGLVRWGIEVPPT